jgi:hypothetical protein
MARLAVLVVLSLALAGCVGPVADTTPTATPGTTPTATPGTTPTATPYLDEMVTFPDGPKERPSLPDELTRESAGEYAVAHEYRFRYNELHEPGAEVGLSEESCGVEDVSQAGSGFTVTVRCSAYVNRPADGTSTETVHYDYPPWTVRYYVDADSVLRTELE